MKVYEGPGAIAHLSGAKVLPVRIDGAQYSPFSRMRGKLRLRWFPKITLTFLPPVKFDTPPGLKGTALRDYLAESLYDVMTDMIFASSPIDKTLFASLLDARATHGGEHQIVEDIQRNPLTYNRIVMGSFHPRPQACRGHTRRKDDRRAAAQCRWPLSSPSSGCTPLAACPAMLNFSTGAVNMAAACAAAQVSTIVTSRQFIEAGNMEEDIKLLSQNMPHHLSRGYPRKGWLVRQALRPLGAQHAEMPPCASAKWDADPNAPAVILFTSGSEGVPKGVVLSHRNIQANRHQAFARIDFTAADIVFNAMPMFHAFGLTAGTMLPGLRGRAHIPLSLAAALQDRAGALLRHQRHGAVRHRYFPDGLCAERPSL